MKDVTRERWAVLLLVAIACGFAGRALHDSILFHVNQPEDETATFARAVEPFRALIPRDATVGYFSDILVDGQEYLRAYYNVRYVLSPVRVAWKRECERLVALFVDPNNLEAFLRQKDYAVEKAGNEGLLLLRKNPR